MMYYFIINPASGSGRGRIVWETIQKELIQQNVTYRYTLLSSDQEGTLLAADISSLAVPCTVVVIGGDGTINDVVNGFSAFDHITFACIPTGSGNDFVRGLSLPSDPEKALQAILHPTEILPINVGKTTFDTPNTTCKTCSGSHARRFMISSGIGFDAAVCYSVDHSRLKRTLNRFHLGKLTYLITALWHLCTMKRPDFRITIDGAQSFDCKKSYFAAAMNLSYEGGGFLFAPEAEPADDQLDLIFVNGISRLHALCLLPLALKGRHVGHKGIHLISCRRIQIEQISDSSERYGSCVHTDGEVPAFAEKITISLEEKKLAVILR